MAAESRLRERTLAVVRAVRLLAVFGLVAAAFAATPGRASALQASGTTTELTGAVTEPQTMSGSIALLGATPGMTYPVIFGFQALSGGGGRPGRLFTGSYRFTFSHCVDGSSSSGDGPEQVTSSAATSGRPPESSNPPSLRTSPTSTSVRCTYRAAFDGRVPAGTVNAVRGVLWVMQSGSVVAQAAGPWVPGPFPPPVAVPQAPSATMLPLLALILFALALVIARWRCRPARQEGT